MLAGESAPAAPTAAAGTKYTYINITPPATSVGQRIPNDQMVIWKCFNSQVLLRLLPNGDWHDWENIFVYVSDLTTVNQEELIDDIIHGLEEALLPGPFKLWLQSKWTDMEVAACQIGLLAMVHGLLQPTVKMFVQAQRDTAAQDQPGPDGPQPMADAPPALAIEDAAADAMQVEPNIDNPGNVFEDRAKRKAKDVASADAFVDADNPKA